MKLMESLSVKLLIMKKLFIVKPLKAFKRIEDKFDLNLIFAPVKKDKTEYIIQKGTELGVSKFCRFLLKEQLLGD